MLKTIAVAILAVGCIGSTAWACCQNDTRKPSQLAGIYGLTNVNCQFTILGQSMSWQCPQGYTLRKSSVYTCGLPAAGKECNPRGNKADYEIYMNGNCGVPTRVGQTPCIAPTKVASSFDWSATAKNCPE